MADLSCPICCETMTAPLVTPCGHTFCHGCVMQWVARKKTCPLCNAGITASTLTKNHVVDNIIVTVSKEVQNAEAVYFDALRQASSDASGKAPGASDLSPIEAVFRRHMRKSLDKFSGMASAMQLQFHRQKSLHEQRIAQIDHLLCQDAEGALRTASSAKLQVERDQAVAKLKDLEAQAQQAMKRLLDGYDKHLDRAMPQPALLPCTVKVFVESIPAKWWELQIQPVTCPAQVINQVLERFSKEGDPVAHHEGLSLCVRSADGEIAASAMQPNVPIYQQTPDGCLPFGVSLVLRGRVVLVSQMPKTCFAAAWVAGTLENYFRCETCGINWICEACSKVCHIDRGHAVVPFLQQHKASYACCYCRKKRRSTPAGCSLCD